MKQQEFNAILQKLQSRLSLDCNEMQQAITWILGGLADEAAVKQFLELLADKGETVAELVGAARRRGWPVAARIHAALDVTDEEAVRDCLVD